MLVEALMVDVDGVLVRGRPRDGSHWSVALGVELGVDVDALQSNFFAIHWEAILIGKDDLRIRLAEVLGKIAPHVTVDQMIEYWFRNDSRLDTELLHALAKVRSTGIQIHLATNQDHERIRYLLNTLELAAHIDGYHYSAALGCRKPHSQFFEAVAQRVDIPPGRLLLIDDNDENVRAAINAGWNGFCWTNEHTLFDAMESVILRPSGASCESDV